MKNMLIAAGLLGAAIAGLVLIARRKKSQPAPGLIEDKNYQGSSRGSFAMG
jgi:hypothetical protein